MSVANRKECLQFKVNGTASTSLYVTCFPDSWQLKLNFNLTQLIIEVVENLSFELSSINPEMQ